MRVNILGPVFDPSGYARLTRRIALGLDEAGMDIGLTHMRWGDAPDGLEPETRRRLHSMCGCHDCPDAIIHIGPAEVFGPLDGQGKSILFTMLESDRIPPHWVQACNRYDEVWTPTSFNFRSFVSSGVSPHRIRVMPLGVDCDVFVPPPPGTRPHMPFTFLSVFEWIPRKGYHTLIPAFACRFRTGNARLVLKVQNNDRYDPSGRAIYEEVRRLCEMADAPEAAERITIVGRILSDIEMARLYQQADAFVLPSSGEGWGFPILEAACTGLPVLCTAWSGPMDYLADDNSYLIPVQKIVPVPSFGGAHDRIYGGSRWAIPDPCGLGDLLEHVYSHADEALNRGETLRLKVASEYSWKSAIERMVTRLS